MPYFDIYKACIISIYISSSSSDVQPLNLYILFVFPPNIMHVVPPYFIFIAILIGSVLVSSLALNSTIYRVCIYMVPISNKKVKVVHILSDDDVSVEDSVHNILLSKPREVVANPITLNDGGNSEIREKCSNNAFDLNDIEDIKDADPAENKLSAEMNGTPAYDEDYDSDLIPDYESEDLIPPSAITAQNDISHVSKVHTIESGEVVTDKENRGINSVGNLFERPSSIPAVPQQNNGDNFSAQITVRNTDNIATNLISNSIEKKKRKLEECTALHVTLTLPPSRAYSLKCALKENHKQSIYSVACCPFSKWDNYFCTVGANRITIYENHSNGAATVSQIYQDIDEEEIFYTCVWSLCNKSKSPIVCASGKTGIIKIIDVFKLKMVQALVGHGADVNELLIHPNNSRLLLSASKDRSLRLWDIGNAKCLVIFSGHEGHKEQVVSTDVHSSGKYIVSAGMDQSIKIWSLDKAEISNLISKSHRSSYDDKIQPIIEQFPIYSTSHVHGGYIDCVSFVGDLVMSKSLQSKVILWRPFQNYHAENISFIKEYDLPFTPVWFIKFAISLQKGDLFAAGNSAGKIYIYHIDTGKRLGVLEHPKCKSTIRQVAFSLDTKTIVAVCDDSTVWRWDC